MIAVSVPSISKTSDLPKRAMQSKDLSFELNILNLPTAAVQIEMPDGTLAEVNGVDVIGDGKNAILRIAYAQLPTVEEVAAAEKVEAEDKQKSLDEVLNGLTEED